MSIGVTLSRTKETKEIQFEKGLKIENVLKKLNLKPDTIIVLHKNKPVPIDEEIKDGQELTILQVSSGG